MIVEVSIKLDNDYNFYIDLLNKNNLENIFNCTTHDIYYTNKNLDGLSEDEMKNSCVRLRIVNNGECKIQNVQVFNELKNISFSTDINEIEKELINKGFNKVFDTKKLDHHYKRNNMNSVVQLQEIDDIGLVLYYDNPKYYDLPLLEQRNKLIDDLNSFGFNFDYNILDFEKLRTLYYKKECFSNN